MPIYEFDCPVHGRFEQVLMGPGTFETEAVACFALEGDVECGLRSPKVRVSQHQTQNRKFGIKDPNCPKPIWV